LPELDLLGFPYLVIVNINTGGADYGEVLAEAQALGYAEGK